MPTILREGPYRFFFFSNENTEPRHVHVESGDSYVKFWLDPVELASSIGYNGRELNIIRRMVLENVDFIKEKWDAHFGR
jgi:hypothetical protein